MQETMRRLRWQRVVSVGLVVALALLALQSLTALAATPTGEGVMVTLRDVQGREVGSANFTPMSGTQYELTVMLAGMEPVSGSHRMALTEVALCEDDFDTAGEEVATLPDIQFYQDGSADYRQDIQLDMRTIDDANGSALVIYADHGTEPGDRILCGTIGEMPELGAALPTVPPVTFTPLPPSLATPVATVAPLTEIITATAMLMDVQGREVGKATLVQEGEGFVTVRIRISGMDPVAGGHGVHIHAIGECSPPDFSSAGGHYNPTEANHGFDDAMGPHAGDLPNMQFYADGSGEYEATSEFLILGPGGDSIFDGNGAALVIHASPDDYVSQPTGNSGERIACGVLKLLEGE